MICEAASLRQFQAAVGSEKEINDLFLAVKAKAGLVYIKPDIEVSATNGSVYVQADVKILDI
ncbi:MAG: hypothetical protein PVG87_20920 [Desulfobacteraceae bacterium]